MFPIVSIINLVTFLVAAITTFYLWRAYQKKKEKPLKYFLYFFLSLNGLFFFIACPFLIFKNISLITFSIIILPSFLYLSLLFISSVSLEIIQWHRLKKIYFMFLSLLLIFSYLMIFIDFEPVQVGISGNFIYWYVPVSRIFWQTGSIINGLASGITMLSIAVFFLISGLKSEEKFVRKRASLITTGLFLLTLAGVINFIVGAVPNLPAHISAGLLAIFGILVLFSGIVIIKPPISNQ